MRNSAALHPPIDFAECSAPLVVARSYFFLAVAYGAGAVGCGMWVWLLYTRPFIGIAGLVMSALFACALGRAIGRQDSYGSGVEAGEA